MNISSSKRIMNRMMSNSRGKNNRREGETGIDN